jgi:allophanate hydrolase subunit 2
MSGAIPGDTLGFIPRVFGEPATLAAPPLGLARRVLRFVKGPQAAMFELAAFTSSAFLTSNQSDRKGVRLEGTFEGDAKEFPSEPACFGVIQITPSGMPIIIGPDGPTIGGYPKIGVVISADLPAVGQLRPGVQIQFEEVAFEQSGVIGEEESRRLARLRTLLLARL